MLLNQIPDFQLDAREFRPTPATSLLDGYIADISDMFRYLARKVEETERKADEMFSDDPENLVQNPKAVGRRLLRMGLLNFIKMPRSLYVI